MTLTVTALYDGKKFTPEKPINLPANARCILTVIPIPDGVEDHRTAVDVLKELAGTIEGPEDWSAEHDHYLYGTPKKRNKRKPR